MAVRREWLPTWLPKPPLRIDDVRLMSVVSGVGIAPAGVGLEGDSTGAIDVRCGRKGGGRAYSSPVAGLITGMVAPRAESTGSLLMKFRRVPMMMMVNCTFRTCSGIAAGTERNLRCRGRMTAGLTTLSWQACCL